MPESWPAASQTKMGTHMENIDLTKAKEFRGASSEQAATQLAKAGWTCINTAAGQDEAGYPLITFSFAWLKEGSPPEPQY